MKIALLSSPISSAIRRRPLSGFGSGVFLAAVLCLAFAPLRGQAPSLTGTYESEGSIVETATDYTGPVSLRALLALEFDLALGAAQHNGVTRVEIEQRDRTFTIRTKDTAGKTEWTGTWERNGGYEPTKDGVKILLRHKRYGEDFFMFTLSPMKDGSILFLEAQRVQATKFGPMGKPAGKFLFLRTTPPL